MVGDFKEKQRIDVFNKQFTTITMLFLSKPVSQSRLNAAVAELVGLRVDGSVCIPGSWDAHSAMQHTKSRLKQPLYLLDSPEKNSVCFCIGNKQVLFTDSMVYVISH